MCGVRWYSPLLGEVYCQITGPHSKARHYYSTDLDRYGHARRWAYCAIGYEAQTYPESLK